MRAIINKSRAKGTVTAPPSKSFAHRMMICAALAGQGSTVRGISGSQDMYATLECISALNGSYDRCGADVSFSSACSPVEGTAVYPCRESGSTLRFFIPLALTLGQSAQFRGTARLIERGIGIYEDMFLPRGITVEKTADSIKLNGRLSAGNYSLMGNVSSQFVSGLMFALPLMDGDSVIEVLPPVESRAYIDITIAVMKSFGVIIEEREENVFFVRGNQKYEPRTLTVEGDWSNAAFLYALRHTGGELEVTGLNENSIQGDRVCRELFERLKDEKPEMDISGCPDLGPIVFAMAACGHGAHITGTRRLRIKESDRAQAMADELSKFGIRTELLENEAVIYPGELHAPAELLSGHNDHRIVMALAVLAALTGGEIEEAQAVSKSYPDFFEAIKSLGIEVETYA